MLFLTLRAPTARPRKVPGAVPHVPPPGGRAPQPGLRALTLSVLFSAPLLAAGAAEDPEDPAGSGEPPAWTSLYDGRDVDPGGEIPGWHNPYEWGEVWAEDGAIALRANRKFFLVTDRTFADFVFEGEVRLPEGKSNSGFMFRCHEKPNRVWGYQAEVDPSDRQWAGGLYDEGRRGWLHPLRGHPEAQAAFQRGEWNRYRIRCEGDRIRIWVNDVLTTDYRDPLDTEGHIALQHHGEEGQIYRFRHLRVRDLGRHRWKPLFDGRSFAGWHTVPGGRWDIREGAIVGWNTADDPRHGLLLTDRSFSDFTARIVYRAVKGNSGFYFRVKEVDSPVNVHGFQAEIDAMKDAGGLYETGGRAWVAQPEPELVEKCFRPGEWNTMTVSAHGGHIVVHVNGTLTSELRDDPGRKEGPFGIQLHGGQDMRVEVRSVELLVPEDGAEGSGRSSGEGEEDADPDG